MNKQMFLINAMHSINNFEFVIQYTVLKYVQQYSGKIYENTVLEYTKIQGENTL